MTVFEGFIHTIGHSERDNAHMMFERETEETNMLNYHHTDVISCLKGAHVKSSTVNINHIYNGCVIEERACIFSRPYWF